MIFVWGSANKEAYVPEIGQYHCLYCDQDGAFARVVTYRSHHIYGFIRWISGVSSYTSCCACGAAHSEHTNSSAPEIKHSIPWWDRRSWLIPVGIIALLIVIGSITSARDGVDNRAFIANPKIGDVYEANLSKLIQNPQARVMYSALHVTAIDGDKIEMEVAQKFYDVTGQVAKDFAGGDAQSSFYYSQSQLILRRSELKSLHNQGIVTDVMRPGS
jgi:hypothetical protein